MATTGYVLPSANANVTSTWDNLANALAEDDNVTSFTTTTKNDDRLWRGHTFNFDSLVPPSASVDAVNFRHRGSRSNGGTLEAWVRISTTDGSASANGNTSLATITVEPVARPGGGSWSRADLLNATFEVRGRGLQPNNTTSRTYSFAWIEVEVVYTVPPQELLPRKARRSSMFPLVRR